MSVTENRAARLRNRLELLRAYLTGGEPRGAVPTAIYIESTSRCNLDCPMCARQLADDAWIDRDMTRADLERALEALTPGCELVLPFAGGEPLLHPDTAWMIARCHERGLRTELATNATLLDGRRGRDLILAGLDTLVISLDAATAETYGQIRRGGDFERTRANISTFLKYKRDLQSQTPWLIVQMVDLPQNRHEAELFRRQWRDLPGVDVVRIKADEVHVEQIRRGVEGREGRPCHFPWLGPMMIRYDGGVYPCCHFWRSDPVGHVSEGDIASIWSGPAMAELRRAHLAGEADRYLACRECQAVVPHPALITGSLLTPPHLTRRAIPFVEALNRRLGQSLIRGS